jgi:phosphopantothenoylcysteine decarboxylase/phosphopantothenate--cysteine ligase
VLVAPAMNVRMWEHPATRANVTTLRGRGVEVIGPEQGELAEGESGFGRMSEPGVIFARSRELLGETDALAGKSVVVTAGGTREPLDSVRYIGNRSSGRMGVTLAEEARRRGAQVTLLAANLGVQAPAGVEVVEAPTAADLAREAKARAFADIVLMAAAVADYEPQPVAGKRPKSGEAWELSLRPTEDILAGLGERKNGSVLVGFGAEAGEDGLERKRRMLTEKHLDLVVFNDISRDDIGFDARDNEVTLITAAGERTVPKAPKERIAVEILDEVERLLKGSEPG